MPPPSTAEIADDLDFLRKWREPVDPRRLFWDGAGSIAIHSLILFLIIFVPEIEKPRHVREVQPYAKKVVHLYYEPTQKAPNKGKVTRELDVRSMQPAPVRQAPKFRPPQPAPGPVAPAPQPVPVPVIEQPKIQVASAPPPPPPIITPQPVQAPPIAPPPQPEKPKLAFESVSAQPAHVEAPNPVQVPMPKSSIQAGAGGTIVGDIGDSSTNIPNLNNTPAAGRIGSNLQLLSDAKGVDFKPYLIQVLTAVRRNWLSIIPESARMGRRGRVLIQFAIDRSGGVPKLVIADGAGTDALDRAAVAAISASYPFPPLPLEYKGDQIRVQLAFSYNLPTR
jgi:TonB family protein